MFSTDLPAAARLFDTAQDALLLGALLLALPAEFARD
jgi:hypothetical protein